MYMLHHINMPAADIFFQVTAEAALLAPAKQLLG